MVAGPLWRAAEAAPVAPVRAGAAPVAPETSCASREARPTPRACSTEPWQPGFNALQGGDDVRSLAASHPGAQLVGLIVSQRPDDGDLFSASRQGDKGG